MTSSGREFQIRGAVTEKARLPTVVDVTGGTRIRFVSAERSARRPDTSATRTSGRPKVAWCTSITDIITHANFFVNRLGGFGVLHDPQNFGISIGLAGRSYNSVSTAVLHCDLDINIV